MSKEVHTEQIEDLSKAEKAANVGSIQNQINEINQLNSLTILLVQFSSNEETRTWIECKTPDHAFETFLRIYENFTLNKTAMQDLYKQEEEN